MLWLKHTVDEGNGQAFHERYVSLQKLVQSRMFDKFGVADTSVLTYSHEVSLTITNDWNLYGAIASQHDRVTHLEHLRSL